MLSMSLSTMSMVPCGSDKNLINQSVSNMGLRDAGASKNNGKQQSLAVKWIREVTRPAHQPTTSTFNKDGKFMTHYLSLHNICCIFFENLEILLNIYLR